MESTNETYDEQSGRIVQDDTESDDDDCDYSTRGIPLSDVQSERDSGLRLCAPNKTGNIYEFVHEDDEIGDEVRAHSTGGTSSSNTQPVDAASEEVRLCASKSCVLVVYSHRVDRERMFFEGTANQFCCEHCGEGSGRQHSHDCTGWPARSFGFYAFESKAVDTYLLDSECELSFADTHDRDWLFEVPEVRAVVRPTILEDFSGNEQEGTYIAVELGHLYNVGQLLDNTNKTSTHTVKDECTVTGQSVHVTCGYGASTTWMFKDRLQAQMDLILYACFGDRGDQNPLPLSSGCNAVWNRSKPMRWCTQALILDPSMCEGDILLGYLWCIGREAPTLSRQQVDDFSSGRIPPGCTHEE